MTRRITDVQRARRHVERAAQQLAAAAVYLDRAGHESEGRVLRNASYEAAMALVSAEGREEEHALRQALEKSR